MASDRIEKIKGKISYLRSRKANKDAELEKLFKKLKRKKNVKLEPKPPEPDVLNNYNINLLMHPIDYGSFIKYLVAPNLLGSLISFAGGYLMFSFNFFFGLLFVLGSFFLVPFVNCLEDKYLVFSKDAAELAKFQKFVLTDNESQLDVDQIWLTKEELLTLQSSLPWYLSEAEIESAAWLNSIIEVIWLQVHSQFNDWLDETFGKARTLDAYIGAGNRLLDLRITQSSLGSRSPYISGVRVVKRGVKKEDAILECELTFDSNLNVQVEGNYMLRFGLERFNFRSKIRVVAGPLFREVPAVGSITVNLIDRPNIEWKFTGCLQILNLNLIKSFAAYFVSYWLGQPLKSKLSIAKFLPLRELKLRDPVELFKVDLIEALNLPRGQMKICCQTKKADTYCLVSIDNDEKSTNVQQDTDNPEWNQTLMFFIYEAKKQSLIEIYVYDEQPDEDELIGYVKMSTEHFRFENSEFNGREFQVQLLDPETKSPLKYGHTKLVFRISWFQLTNELTKIRKSLELSKSLLPVATLSVLVDSASGMETVVHQVQTPELRTLVRITVGNQVQVTSIKERTGYPVWEEVLNFMLFNPMLEDVFVEVVDMYWVMEKRFLMILGGKREQLELDHHYVKLSHEGLVLGYTTIRTTDILNNFQMKKQGTFQLEGYSEEAFIRLLLTIRLTEFSQSIYTNQSQPRIAFPDLESYDKNFASLKGSFKSSKEANQGKGERKAIGQAPKMSKTNLLKSVESVQTPSKENFMID